MQVDHKHKSNHSESYRDIFASKEPSHEWLRWVEKRLLSNQHRFLPIFIIALISISLISAYEYDYLNTKLQNEQSGIHITGTIKIYQGDKLIRSIPDAIQNSGGEDTMLCQIFNNTNECANATAYYGSATNQIGTACQYWKGVAAPSLTNGFYDVSLCTPTGIALSTDNTPISTNTGCPVLTASNLAPVQSTQVQQSSGQSSNSIILTASYAPSGTQTINKLCLIMWNTHSGTYSAANNVILGNGANAVNAVAIDAVSPAYTTTNGIPFTVQWTITLSFS